MESFPEEMLEFLETDFRAMRVMKEYCRPMLTELLDSFPIREFSV